MIAAVYARRSADRTGDGPGLGRGEDEGGETR